MKSALKSLTPYLKKIDALTPRERVILFVLMLAGLWAVVDMLVLAPQVRALQTEQQKLTDAHLKIAETEQRLAERASLPNPALIARQRLESAQQALNARMQTTTQLQARMVQPKDMVGVLQGMLSEDAGLRSGLRLVRLDTLPPEPVGQPVKDKTDKTAPLVPAAAIATEAAPLFKHGIQLTLVGNYASLTRYMEKLEHLPAGFYWARAELDANGHPEISLTLTLYTLSLEKTWLTV